jgi:methyltransferase (TIGR00027 family)
VNKPERLIRNISDTARWVAVYRADETERPDALFRDPYARRLMGERGPQIADAAAKLRRDPWPFVVRTYLFDEFISRAVAGGCDLVVNLAAGLDARPYRMPLPPSLQWVEIDLPEIIDEKTEILRADKPVCSLERIRLDLADVNARRTVFDDLGRRAKKTLILSEGLVIYLSREEVGALADDLAKPPSFRQWVVEIASPGLLKMMERTIGKRVREAGAPLKFGPEEGPDFFVPHRWKPTDVRSMFGTAAKLRRLPFFMQLMSFLPESNGRQGRRPWTGVCFLEKTAGP